MSELVAHRGGAKDVNARCRIAECDIAKICQTPVPVILRFVIHVRSDSFNNSQCKPDGTYATGAEQGVRENQALIRSLGGDFSNTIKAVLCQCRSQTKMIIRIDASTNRSTVRCNAADGRLQ